MERNRTNPPLRNRARRDPPAVVVVVPLEGRGSIHLICDTAEDERRLRSWLRRSRELSATVAEADWLFDQLDNEAA